jgi:hypothetical protein
MCLHTHEIEAYSTMMYLQAKHGIVCSIQRRDQKDHDLYNIYLLI